MHHLQLRTRPGRDPAGPTDQRLALAAAGDGDHDALTGLPGVGDLLLRAVATQRHVDLVCQPQQRELAQRRQIAGAEVVAQRGVHPVGRVDVAVRHAAAQRFRSYVGEFDLPGAAHHLVRHGFLLPHAGDRLHHIVEALQVLHVHRRQHVDPGLKQFVDVLPPLFVAGAGRVGVREFVDDGDRGFALQHGIDVHLGQFDPAVAEAPARQHLQPVEQRGGLGSAVVLDEANHHVRTALDPTVRLVEHRVGLADPWRRTEVDPQLAASSSFLRHASSLLRTVVISGCHRRVPGPISTYS